MKNSNNKGINAIYPFAILCIIARTIGETSKISINYPPFLVFIEYIGYLSFPLLLYLFTNVIEQKNLKLLTLRLYIIGVACGVFRSVLNYILLDISNVSMGIENFIFVLFFIVVCLLVVQLLCDGVKEKNKKMHIRILYHITFCRE